ncbi:hypothetical protein M426DRAFT_325840 [Hypoxylon sp. CI-4A]|nr:hypothetical protein M426DRAFT_325840 [Hypoxylon sp. CI-4A]
MTGYRKLYKPLHTAERIFLSPKFSGCSALVPLSRIAHSSVPLFTGERDVCLAIVVTSTHLLRYGARAAHHSHIYNRRTVCRLGSLGGTLGIRVIIWFLLALDTSINTPSGHILHDALDADPPDVYGILNQISLSIQICGSPLNGLLASIVCFTLESNEMNMSVLLMLKP